MKLGIVRMYALCNQNFGTTELYDVQLGLCADIFNRAPVLFWVSPIIQGTARCASNGARLCNASPKSDCHDVVDAEDVLQDILYAGMYAYIRFALCLQSSFSVSV